MPRAAWSRATDCIPTPSRASPVAGRATSTTTRGSGRCPMGCSPKSSAPTTPCQSLTSVGRAACASTSGISLAAQSDMAAVAPCSTACPSRPPHPSAPFWRLLCFPGARGCTSAASEEDAMEFDDIEPLFYEDDLEEFERNQLANDRAYERDDEGSSGEETEDFGDLID